MIKCAYKNILEAGAVSLTAGAEDPGYPLYRLYDRGVGRMFRASSAQTLEIAIDQGAALFGDDFNDNSIDPAKWNEADTAAKINEANQRIEGRGSNNWNVNGLVSGSSVSLAEGLTWCFTVSPQYAGNNVGLFGPVASAALSYSAHGCQVRFWQSGSDKLDVWLNGSNQSTGYGYQALKTYHVRIAYRAPGWKVYVMSPDDASYSSETLIYSTAADSTGPMYFQANFSNSAGLTYLDNVSVYSAGAFEAADRLLIPAGHNLAGATLGLMWSHDGVNYFNAVAVWAGAAGLVNKSWSAKTARFWKFIVASPSSAPELAEMFLALTYEWARNPSRPAGPLEEVFNVERSQTASGQDRFLVHGAARRRRAYRMPRCGEAHRGDIVALYDAWAGSNPFWLEDHAGDWIFGRLAAPLNLKETAHESYSFDFDFTEVL